MSKTFWYHLFKLPFVVGGVVAITMAAVPVAIYFYCTEEATMNEHQYVIAMQISAEYSRLMMVWALNESEQQLHDSSMRLLYTYNILAERIIAASLAVNDAQER